MVSDETCGIHASRRKHTPLRCLGYLSLFAALLLGGTACSKETSDASRDDARSWEVRPDTSGASDEDVVSTSDVRPSNRPPDASPSDTASDTSPSDTSSSRDLGDRSGSDTRASGELVVSPSPVEFPATPPGERFTRRISIYNTQSTPITITSSPSIEGSGAFRVHTPDSRFPVELSNASSNTEARFLFDLEVTYQPGDNTSDTAELVVPVETESGDTRKRRIDLRVADRSRCLLVAEASRDFGKVPVGDTVSRRLELQNCGSDPVEVRSMRFSQNAGGAFDLKLGDRDSNDDGRLDGPLVLDGGEAEVFDVAFGPSSAGLLRGTLRIETNESERSTRSIELRGRGAPGATCPRAKLAAKVRGTQMQPSANIRAEPLEYILLDGSGSTGNEAYHWRVLEKPADTTVDLRPPRSGSGTDGKRVFRALTSGEYEIGLRVENSQGVVSCNEAVATIVVGPEDKIHVQLTWTTPKDPDETDGRGSDLDLHVVKMGPGKWFRKPYDVYARNQGGSGLWNPESPELDIDDTNGAGPENISLDDPEPCQWYAVGVHYYKKMFGTAYVTVRIYSEGQLVYEQLDIPLKKQGQFLDLARLHWSGNSPKLRPLTRNKTLSDPPNGEPPTVTGNMKSSGVCTKQGLY